MPTETFQIRVGDALATVEVLSPAEALRVWYPRQVRIDTTCLNCDQPMRGAKYPYLFCRTSSPSASLAVGVAAG